MTAGNITPLNDLQLRRFHNKLLSIIQETYRHSTKRPGRLLSLLAFTHAYDETRDDRLYSHYALLVKDLEENDTTAMRLTFAVNEVIPEEPKCSVNY